MMLAPRTLRRVACLPTRNHARSPHGPRRAPSMRPSIRPVWSFSELPLPPDPFGAPVPVDRTPQRPRRRDWMAFLALVLGTYALIGVSIYALVTR
jgi:hypothetical protein